MEAAKGALMGALIGGMATTTYQVLSTSMPRPFALFGAGVQAYMMSKSRISLGEMHHLQTAISTTLGLATLAATTFSSPTMAGMGAAIGGALSSRYAGRGGFAGAVAATSGAAVGILYIPLYSAAFRVVPGASFMRAVTLTASAFATTLMGAILRR